MDRRVDLEGCFNFRDLGGYPARDGRTVRWRRLFRSDALHHLTPGDVARFLGELGIRDVVDLRSSLELEAEGRGLLADSPAARFHHVPLFDTGAPAAVSGADVSLADRYVAMAEHGGPAMGRVVAILAQSEAPAVYHCAAGKDRTGMISALVLELVGVDDELILEDYAASQENIRPIVERLLGASGYRSVLETLPKDTLHARPDTMLSFLECLRERYGSVEGFARHVGVSDEQIAALREKLLEG